MNTTGQVLTVTQLSRMIRSLVEDGLPLCWVEGEVSNFKLHSSGHRYFTLKDEGAQIACVLWRTRNTGGVEIKNGLNILAHGKVTVWEQAGRYQMDVQAVLLKGKGSLQAQFEALKEKLAAEGLFDSARKRRLPCFPRAIGIVTSPTGAAVRDFAWGFKTLFPPAQLYLMPVAVQGEGAAEQIAAAIQFFNRQSLVDLIIIGRGGGPLEDLWAFNEEVVVRAVASSRLPVVSAVGHEVDITLSDLAADLRAPTPTGAAPLVVPDRKDLLRLLHEREQVSLRAFTRKVNRWRERLMALTQAYGFKSLTGRIAARRLRLDDAGDRLERSLALRIRRQNDQLKALSQRIDALSPRSVLKRGFSVVRKRDNAIVRRADEIVVGERLKVIFAVGQAAVEVKEIA